MTTMGWEKFGDETRGDTDDYTMVSVRKESRHTWSEWGESELDYVLGLLEREEWQHRGACNGMDPNLFFPSRGEPMSEIRAVCSTCPVRRECAEAGLMEKWGMWGGTSERERRRIRRDRNREAA